MPFHSLNPVKLRCLTTILTGDNRTKRSMFFMLLVLEANDQAQPRRVSGVGWSAVLCRPITTDYLKCAVDIVIEHNGTQMSERLVINSLPQRLTAHIEW